MIDSMIKVYEEGGRGKKQCPSCSKYVGAISKKCICGHIFQTKEHVSTVIQTYDEGGKGKKQCPSCKKYIGGRNRECACGHQFGIQEHSPLVVVENKPDIPPRTIPKPIPKPEPRHDIRGGRLIHTPAGDCPSKLTGISAEEVEVWTHSVLAKGREKGENYLFAALRYWVREFYDIGSSDYNEVVALLKDMSPREAA